MLISITLSTIQKGKADGGNDELAILKEISEKLIGISDLEKINDQLNGWRVEFRDERLCKLNCVSAHNSINYFKHRIKDEQTHGRQET